MFLACLLCYQWEDTILQFNGNNFSIICKLADIKVNISSISPSLFQKASCSKYQLFICYGAQLSILTLLIILKTRNTNHLENKLEIFDTWKFSFTSSNDPSTKIFTRDLSTPSLPQYNWCRFVSLFPEPTSIQGTFPMRPAFADSHKLRWRLVKPEIHMCKLRVSRK